jgi:hypothetical protein
MFVEEKQLSCRLILLNRNIYIYKYCNVLIENDANDIFKIDNLIKSFQKLSRQNHI